MTTNEPDILPLGSRGSSIETWRSTVTATVHVTTPAESANKGRSAPVKADKKISRGPSKDQIKPLDVVRGLGLDLTFEEVPEKLEFKIGEVADILGVKAYVLRFWETEFDILKPEKAKNNQRVYTQKDVQLALLVKHLLYTEKYSIEGARVALAKAKDQARSQLKIQASLEGAQTARARLKDILENIRSLRAFIRG